MKLNIKSLLHLAIIILIALATTSSVESNKRLNNPGDNRFTNWMNTKGLGAQRMKTINLDQSSSRESRSVAKEEKFEELTNSRETYKAYLSPERKLTIQLSWNKTEIPALNVILQRTDGTFLKVEKNSEKNISVKKYLNEDIASEIVNLGKIKKGIFNLYMKLEHPKTSIDKANVKLTINDNKNEVEKFRLDRFFPKGYWYFGLFDYYESVFLTRGGEILELKEIEQKANKYLKEKLQKQEEKEQEEKLNKKSSIRKIKQNDVKQAKKNRAAKTKQKNCPSEKQVVMKWLKNLLADMLAKGKNLKSLVKKGFSSEKSFLQTNEKSLVDRKNVPKKVKRLLVIFPMRRIIILRGKKLINGVKSLPIWKKRIFIRMLKQIIMRTIRANKIRKVKIHLTSKIKNLLTKIQQAKLNNNKNTA